MIKPTAIIHLLALAIAVVIHEVAHGYVAYKLGDDTAKRQGRLTLNPIPHIDLFGTIIVPLLLLFSGSGFLIGWAKPVPVNAAAFRQPLKDMMWVALAGPVSNLLLATGASVLFKLSHGFGSINSMPALYGIYFLESMVVINIVLAIFNLVPIPPLDGSKILAPFLPYKWQSIMMQLEPYGLLLVFAAVYFGVFNVVIRFFVPPIIGFLL
ncbi:MAG: site-2 protease family protein [bacterium]|nr:site-2 protease family protein [bacterium]